MVNSLTDVYKLNNGVEIPCVGFGTWQTPDGQVAIDSVRKAIEVGYIHIDTAAFYGNEKGIGEAIRTSGVDRKKLFITSKVWNTERGYEKTLKSFDKSMEDLGIDYMDLFLIHWPANKENGPEENADTWRAMEKLYKEGRIRSIGVSNFLIHHLESLMEKAEVTPMVNQIEIHPGQRQMEVVEFCKKNNIIVEAWSPLGTGRMLTNPQLKEIANKYGVSVARLCIRWCLQNETLPLPKSVTPERIVENTHVFDFHISVEDMQLINEMPYIGGSGLDPDKIDF